ncbi:MAG: T9SS type A sorting domain-containing protein [Crocinitomicaceae bacterium]|nr:T9SS type A sorting domain-containing protein [Crocinitomicaceae bacterium]
MLHIGKKMRICPWLIGIFPNPTEGLVSVEITQPIPAYYSIIDIGGRVVERSIFPSAINTVNLSHIPAGIYLLETVGKAKWIFEK